MRSKLREVLVVVALGVLLATAGMARAEDKEVKIGVIFDLTGPFAAGGSEAAAIGTMAAIDYINEHGGIEGYKIKGILADAQSKAEVAIAEAERLLNQENVDLILGVYSSAHCVPLAQKINAEKKFLWATVCTASSVLKDKHLNYVFRPQVHTDQYAENSCAFVAAAAKEELGIDPKDVKVAIIHEDGPYGAGIGSAGEAFCKQDGLQVVLREGYSASTPDLSSLVTKLRRARPDVILHVGYYPDITLFLRQAREQGLKWKALIGHGAGYSQYENLKKAVGDDIEYAFNTDPGAAQLLNPESLEPGLGDLVQEMVKRWREKKGEGLIPPHMSMGFNNTWIFLTKVLGPAIRNHGGFDPEALRQTALEVDIPEGGTMQGYGVKFAGPDDVMAGQNLRSFPVVTQYVGGKSNIVWPLRLRTADPVMPLPKGSTFAP